MLAVGEFQHGSVDKEVMELALAENRILPTEDKDFGWLVFAGHVDSPGVIPIRFPASARGSLGDAVSKLVRKHASQLAGSFVVLQPGTARINFGPRHAQ